MRLRLKRIADKWSEEWWIVFWEGNIAQPVAVLTQIDMERFFNLYQEEKSPLNDQ